MLKILPTLFVLFILSFSSDAKPVPKLKGPVMDQTGLLGTSYKFKLSKVLKKLHKDTGTQLQIFLFDSLEGEPIENYSYKVVEKWKLGGETNDRGILFLMSLSDRKMRLEVGDGLEGQITDLKAGRIIDGLKPYFKNRQFASGISFMVSQIIGELGGNLETVPAPSKKKWRSSSKSLIFFIVIYLLIVIFGRGRRRRSFLYHRSGGRWSGSSGSSWGGGSSGWSGGGGSFSGGGASGDW